MKVSIKTGDTVYVNSGKDAGKQGKVLAVKFVKGDARVVVEGVNIVTKAKKARTAQDKSELVKMEAPIDISNVNVVCPSCGKAVRIRHLVQGDKKVRVCAKCSAVLDSKFVAAAKTKKEAKSAEKAEEVKAEKPAKTEKKSKVTKSAPTEEKATKVAAAKKPQTSRSSQRGV